MARQQLSAPSIWSTLALTLALTALSPAVAQVAEPDRPLLITVDDLPMAGRQNQGAAERARITDGLLAALAKHQIRAVGLVTWGNVQGESDLELLGRWLEAGHELGNHSYAHLSYTSTDTQTYIDDIERARQELASFLNKKDRKIRFFRFPMLREGSTPEKLAAMRAYLKETGQRNLPVTLDNQDWSFERPWSRAVAAGDEAEMERIATAYHESMHLSIRHHERTAGRLFERPVPQILLLHAGSVGAAQWDRLFRWLKAEGYRFADVDEVLKDPAFSEAHDYVGDRGPGLWDRILHRRRQEQAHSQVQALIDRQVEAWNTGDLEAFCAEYTEDTVFISPSGRAQGRQQVLERYRHRYPDRASRGHLTLEILDFEAHSGTEVSMLGDARPGRVHTVSVVGRWTLEYPLIPDKEAASGLTLLVLGRDSGGAWKIIRDASM